LALEFKDYIMAFPTIDMVFQVSYFVFILYILIVIYMPQKPTWAHTQKELPPPHRMVLEDLLGFLDRLAKWIAQRKDGRSKRDGLACEVMRDAPEIWPGVGVYTVVEAFFLAGESTS
jgi:hypothetical protein